MTAKPTPEPGADRPAAPPPSSDARPTFQTPASEAVEVAAQAVARQVALTSAANASAAMAAAEAQAALEATAAVEVAEAVSSTRANGSPEIASAGDPPAAPAFDAGGQPGSVAPAMASADEAPSMAVAASVQPVDASMAAAAPAPTANAWLMPSDPVAPTASAPPAQSTPAVSRKPSRPVVFAWTRRFVIFVVSIALLAGGIMLGSTTFLRTRTTPTAGGAVEFSQPPADVAKEFITALAADDSDAIRSSLSTQTNKDLIDEFTKFGIKKVNTVETLGTSVDGPRSATEVLLHTTDSDGNTFDINLIILVNGNGIEGFR